MKWACCKYRRYCLRPPDSRRKVGACRHTEQLGISRIHCIAEIRLVVHESKRKQNWKLISTRTYCSSSSTPSCSTLDSRVLSFAKYLLPIIIIFLMTEEHHTSESHSPTRGVHHHPSSGSGQHHETPRQNGRTAEITNERTTKLLSRRFRGIRTPELLDAREKDSPTGIYIFV